MDQDKRQFRRLRTDFISKIRGKRTSAAILEALESKIKDLSLGGVFIDTTQPFSRGTLVDIEFKLPGTNRIVMATGIVRWSSADADRCGMGIEFIKVSTPNKKAISDYIEKRMVSDVLLPLIRTPLHAKLLRCHARQVGGGLSLEALAGLLETPVAPLVEVLEDFITAGLVHIDESQVRFLESSDLSLASAIKTWVEGN